MVSELSTQQTHYEGLILPSEAHDWYPAENGPDGGPEGAVEFWACFQGPQQAQERLDEFARQNPGKKAVLVESTINLRFRVIDTSEETIHSMTPRYVYDAEQGKLN